MAENNKVLSFGPLQIRSNQIGKRIKEAVDNGVVNADYVTEFYFQGFDSPGPLTLVDKEFPDRKPHDDGGITYSITGPSGYVFFDQTQYNLTFDISEARTAWVFSPLAAWAESYDWDDKNKRLTLPFNFYNDLGDFEICLEWMDNDEYRHSAVFRSRVYSTKLDINSHTEWMIKQVSDRFNWIRLDMLRSTNRGWSVSGNAETNDKSWLSIFMQVRSNMEKGFRRLVNRCRQRLLPEVRYLKAEKLRKIPARLEEKIAEGLIDNPEKRYRFETRRLNADTPENRYMKNILLHTISSLNSLIDRLEKVARMSDVFRDRLKEWSQNWEILSQHHFWKSIGDFRELKGASQVLSQDPVYASVRRSWQLLRQGMELLDNDIRGGIQNISQLYEIWCFVQLDRIIRDLGWECFDTNEENSLVSEAEEWDSDEPVSGSFKMSYHQKDRLVHDIYLDLLFQPKAAARPADDRIWKSMTSLPVNQKPDIALRLHRYDMTHRPTYTWIFDAKYRLNNNDAPDDAINDMHRYRDAILWAADTAGRYLKRESLGAYILFPGTDNDKSAQFTAINQVNIGAIPYKPVEKFPENQKEKSLLYGQIKKLITIDSNSKDRDLAYFKAVPNTDRPCYSLVLVGATRSEMKSVDYWKKCRFYRLPKNEAVKYEQFDPMVIDFIAPQNDPAGHFGLFPVLNYQLMKRKEIVKIYQNEGIEIKPDKDENQEYWIFYLGEPLQPPGSLTNLSKNQVLTINILDD